ncbi:hypothetical protein PYCCODRAFT_971093 [Trametes coccinea BRFM310]|uniref:Uncharacterized protein n=1 Tax=Trametes coccinea (strain BRFM310) TaxID=1353009 RepID=A0A1Y2IC80_TRAC3|nr:hypothetical protein PYCCODRAFT_971093 [Trametes coccinea BRFM310]
MGSERHPRTSAVGMHPDEPRASLFAAATYPKGDPAAHVLGRQLSKRSKSHLPAPVCSGDVPTAAECVRLENRLTEQTRRR